MCHRHSHAHWGGHRHAPWKRGFHQQFQQHFNRPPADISEKEEHFEILLFVPGLDKSRLNIRVKNDELIVLYQAPKNTFEEDSIVMDFEEPEYSQPSFRRSFRLNNKVLVEQIGAAYTDGVLKITLPKNPETNRPVHQVTIDD